ncbi:MAG TPA: O-antigen ligase family protein [Hymenobacter sp.]|uniref:O-antigen ligase family protein n=1 Tax=Hymenobacter sp. TaxID=1898978 RepID=UPI002D8035A3|nr:O-antigen ligase family protein [Hymenobacter sp.]HET9506194.1 O-antigen ligase family protein [Hymenobacter sp.]
MEYYYSGRLSQHLLWLASLAGVVGLLASRALVALSPVAGVLAVLLNPHLRRDVQLYFRNGAALRAAAMVGFLLLSGLYTSEWAVWRHELFRSLTWLGVPLAFAAGVPLSGRQRWVVGTFYVLSTAAVGLATVVKYWLDPASGNAAIHIGQNVQAVTGVFHIFFGVLLALAAFWGAAMASRPREGLGWRLALGAAAAVAAAALHVLAYRTGLLVFYVGLLVCAGGLLLRRNLGLGLGLLLLLGLGPWLAYTQLESVQLRVNATLYDAEQFEKGRDLNNFSLSQRLTAMQAALPVIRQHWLLGVGPADTHAAMRDQYDWRSYGLKRANQADVHSQYLETLLGGGVVGLALWLAVVFWPLTQAWARRDAYLCLFILLQAATMLVTDVLSLQIGLNLFVFGYGFLVVAGERRQQEAATSASSGTAPLSFSRRA